MSDVVEITAGSFHSLARKSDGTLWGWGANFQGQLGDGSNNSRQTPALIASITDVESISAGWDFTVAAKDDGTVWSWGSNSNGQLGDGSTMSSLIPVAVAGISNIEKVAAKYYHVLALRSSDGTVWAWGGNWQGQLGNGTTTNSSNPVQVQGLSGVIAIAAGHDHSVALKSDGTVWAWGNQSTLGVEIVADYRIPVQVTSLSGITSISAGSSYTLAVGGDGTVWAWGHNWSGQLGDGTTNYRLLPTAVTAP
jgi:alpha-tubulin suppressor-like RCC1 family protein